MAKKKKETEIGFGSNGNPFMDALDEMLSGLSEEQQMQLMDNLNTFVQSGKNLTEMQEDMYTYQCSDYTQKVKPLAECLVPLQNAAKPSEVLASYEQAHKAMALLSQQEQEDALRNFFMWTLVDGLNRDFDQELDASALPMIAAFQLVVDFQLAGLFDVILETMKQSPKFYEFYYSGFEDVATMILSRVGIGHLEEMKEMMKTDGFVSEVYPIILNAVVQMALDYPSRRLQVLAWVADVLKSCVDVTIPAMAMDWVVKSLAQIKAVELLPLVKTIYKEYKVPPVEIKNGIKGVTKLLTKGTDERIVENATFIEVLEELETGEVCGFELDDDFGGGRGWNIDAWLNDDDDEEEEYDRDYFFPVPDSKGAHKSKVKGNAKSGSKDKRKGCK